MSTRRWFDPKFLEAKSEEIKFYAKDKYSFTLNGKVIINEENIQEYVNPSSIVYGKANYTSAKTLSLDSSSPTDLTFLSFTPNLSASGITQPNPSLIRLTKKGLYHLRYQIRVIQASTVGALFVVDELIREAQTQSHVKLIDNQQGVMVFDFFWQSDVDQTHDIGIALYGERNDSVSTVNVASYVVELYYLLK